MRLLRLLKRPEAALFALAFVAYAYFYQAGGWNQNVRFDLVRSLVEKRTTIIDGYHVNTGDLSCRGDNGRCIRARPELHEHYYCDKAPGVSLLGIPPYIVFHVFASKRPSERYLTWASYVSTLTAVAIPSALGLVMLFMLLIALGLRRWHAVALALGYGFATLSFPYSTLFYGHQTAAALLVAAFALLVRARHVEGARPYLGLVGVFLGFSVVSEYPAALGVIPITIYAAVYFRPWKRLIWFAVGGAACAALLAAYHWAAFGGPLTLPYEASTQKFRTLGYFMGLGAPNYEAFSNTLWTSYRGLFFSSPWLLLAFPGAFFMLRRRRYRAEAIVSLAIFGLFVWMTASLLESWHGGWGLGARYLLPAIPFLVILIAGFVLPARQDRARRPTTPRDRWIKRGSYAAYIGLTGYSALLMLGGTAVRPEVPQHIKKPFSQYLMPNFYEGNLSINPQAITMIVAPRGKPPAKAFNLGQLIGLKGIPSLLPMFLLMAGAMVWFIRVGKRAPEPESERP